MNVRPFLRRILAFALLSSAIAAAQASTAATDNALNPAYQTNDNNGTNDSNPANNTNGWVSGDNGGTGFGAWTLNASGAGGRYIGATGDGGSGTEFGLFGGGTAGADLSSADRPFTGALLSGDKLTFDLGTTAIATGGVVGFNLLDGSTPVFTMKFTGGQSFWQLNDGQADFNTTIGFSANTQISFSFTYNGGSSYSVVITEGGTTYTANNLAHSTISNITGVRFFSNSQGSGNNFGFNDLTITPVPEPSIATLLGGPAILGAWFFVRRRRS